MPSEERDVKNLNIPQPIKAIINIDAIETMIFCSFFAASERASAIDPKMKNIPNIEIPININGVGKNIKLFPKTVYVHFKVAQKDYNNVRANQFEVIPDIENIDIQNVVRLHLKLNKKPEFVRNITLDPSDVEFLIIK